MMAVLDAQGDCIRAEAIRCDEPALQKEKGADGDLLTGRLQAPTR